MSYCVAIAPPGGNELIRNPAIYSTTIYFSYSQFHIFDRLVRLPGCAWSEAHYRQGFARGESHVNFGTLLEFGRGDVVILPEPYEGNETYERVIEVPFEVLSGEIVVAGPEEVPCEPALKVMKGHYRLTAAQKVTGTDRELIELYLDQVAEPLGRSRIIVADGGINPGQPLVESAETA